MQQRSFFGKEKKKAFQFYEVRQKISHFASHCFVESVRVWSDSSTHTNIEYETKRGSARVLVTKAVHSFEGLAASAVA